MVSVVMPRRQNTSRERPGRARHNPVVEKRKPPLGEEDGRSQNLRRVDWRFHSSRSHTAIRGTHGSAVDSSQHRTALSSTVGSPLKKPLSHRDRGFCFFIPINRETCLLSPPSYYLHKRLFIQNRHPQFFGFFQLTPRLLASNQIIRGRRDTSCRLAAGTANRLFSLFPTKPT